MDVSFEEEFSFPFKAYDNQAKMAREVYRHLKASSDSFGDKKMAGRTKDVLFIESPTGTGKTITLLCAIHRYLKEFYATQQESALEVPVQKSVKFDTWLAEKESRYFESKQTAKTKELIKIKQELRDHIDLITNDVTSGTAFDDNQASRLKKIIFCSRTHSQLNQVLSEFKKLKCFNNFSLSIAGSRSKYCINTDVNGIKDHNHLNNQCRSLVREKSCKYYDEAAINQHKFSIL
ncbi:MAG: DEAD H (Asp-Glu-Ala-Asp His) box helicase 11, partial [Marteilia pararefringens]